jgi:nitrite reductase/ring-hydroxylating ferredoxin subunit/uncharacterized membrane protein
MAGRSRHVGNQSRERGMRVLAILGRQEWLDRPSYRFEHILGVAFNALGGARDRVTNAVHGVWLGHPLHPPLASLSTGSIGTTVALDVLGVLPGPARVRDASRFAVHTLGVGILANMVSAVTGLADWQHTHERDRRIGVVHGALNAVAMGLYAMSWSDRRGGRHRRGIATNALGYGITISSAYLGGALVFGSGIGIDHSGERLRVEEWTPVLPLTSLQDGKPQRVEVDGMGLVLCRAADAQVSAFGEYCPHLAAPMADAWIDRGRIVCPWHGSRFAIESGHVLRGPAVAPLPCYQTRLVDGVIEVRGDTQHPLAAAKGGAK